jgi:hypothetical protein
MPHTLPGRRRAAPLTWQSPHPACAFPSFRAFRRFEPFPRLVRLIIERLRLRGKVACRPQCPQEEQDLQARALDELAAEYDSPFTESAIGKTMQVLVRGVRR